MAVQEITLVVTTDRDLTKDDIEILGRNAAWGLLERSGNAVRYSDHPSIAAEVRFNGHKWVSRSYIGPGEYEEWCVTDEEIERYHPEDDDDEW